MLNYKKPKFWVIVFSVIIVTVIGIGLISNSKDDKAKKLGTTLFSEDDFIKKLFKEYYEQGKELNLASV